MTKQEAHEFLDAARAGAEASQDEITEALIATGDLDEDGMFVHVHSPSGTWERERMAAHFAPAGFWDGLAA